MKRSISFNLKRVNLEQRKNLEVVSLKSDFAHLFFFTKMCTFPHILNIIAYSYTLEIGINVFTIISGY